MNPMHDDNWYYSVDHNELCKIIETQTLWGDSFCRIWLPQQDKVVRIPASRLLPAIEARTCSTDYVAYVSAAARIAEALTQDVLLAPLVSSIIPLPHQIQTLYRAISGDSIRYLLADEVGLGKTIEAGLIMRELKLRGLVNRTLIVVPKGLVTQWATEMHNRFGEEFQVVIPGDIHLYHKATGEANIWRHSNQLICPMDSVKPLDIRRGWLQKKVDEYNKGRFEDLISAGWDLVIVDEAHRLGGSTDQVARYRLGQGLAEATPYLLLLSATPHQGKTDSFQRVLSLLDKEQFPGTNSISRDRVQPYVIRTEKRRAIDIEGKPLFKPRRTQLEPASWQEKHQKQRLLYDAVTDYVRNGYNQAMREKRSYIGFLMILMQRLVVSSTRAICTTLERRAEVLEAPEEQLLLFPSNLDTDWTDMDGQEQLEAVLKGRLMALKNEKAQVNLLLDTAKRCGETGPDAKAEALLDWIYKLQQEEGEPDLKILIFTEFVPTQEMLKDFLAERGFSVVCLNGSLDIDQRVQVQEDFAKSTRILISTDAGGEGLNLQFCHIVINYDIPWNPMRLEQRIGRVDRIGQEHIVRAINLVLEDSVEHRILEVLEQKLAVILKEFGVDKTADILDSAEAEKIFDNLYVEAILHPETIESTVESAVAQVQAQAHEWRINRSLLNSTAELSLKDTKQVLEHPLPHWIERMTTSYVRAQGGSTEQKKTGWTIIWPDGVCYEGVFVTKETIIMPAERHLTLEDRRIRDLVMKLPRAVAGQPIPFVSVPSLQRDLNGIWCLLQINVSMQDWSQKRIIALFMHDDGRVLLPTARRIWDLMLSDDVVTKGYCTIEESNLAFQETMENAETYGKDVYEESVASLNARSVKEEKKIQYAFAARRRAIQRIGLPAVRNHRLTELEKEERLWHKQFDRNTQINPEIVPVLILRVEGGQSGE
ncbi:MAG: helicase-related protein [Dehalococcoidales bacterium]|nr:helicase-related protein [Dehalococcoidales bacterium]